MQLVTGSGREYKKYSRSKRNTNPKQETGYKPILLFKRSRKSVKRPIRELIFIVFMLSCAVNADVRIEC